MPFDPKQLKFYEEAVVLRNAATGLLDKIVTKSGEVMIDFASFAASAFRATTNTTAPVISPATATTGTVMSSTTGVWTYEPISYTYAWQLDGSPIDGATDSTYTVLVGDLTHAITCEVTATNRAGAAVSAAESNSVTPTA